MQYLCSLEGTVGIQNSSSYVHHCFITLCEFDMRDVLAEVFMGQDHQRNLVP